VVVFGFLNRRSASCVALLASFTEIQDRSKREKQLKESMSKLQQTIKDLSSSVRSQRTSLAKLLELLQLPVEPQASEDEDVDAFENANFDAVETRVKELLASAESESVRGTWLVSGEPT
jgi:septal ring factor EnvC (AmiA/AmiB activator)